MLVSIIAFLTPTNANIITRSLNVSPKGSTQKGPIAHAQVNMMQNHRRRRLNLEGSDQTEELTDYDRNRRFTNEKVNIEVQAEYGSKWDLDNVCKITHQ